MMRKYILNICEWNLRGDESMKYFYNGGIPLNSDEGYMYIRSWIKLDDLAYICEADHDLMVLTETAYGIW